MVCHLETTARNKQDVWCGRDSEEASCELVGTHNSLLSWMPFSFIMEHAGRKHKDVTKVATTAG